MLIQLLIKVFIGMITVVFGWLPAGSTLPTFGTINLDTIFSTGFGYFHFLAGIFPPLTTVATAASIYLGWRLVLIVVKLILGHRTPAVNTA